MPLAGSYIGSSNSVKSLKLPSDHPLIFPTSLII
jgi:hypothetical protein